MSLLDKKGEILEKLDLVAGKMMNLGINEKEASAAGADTKLAEFIRRDSGINTWDWPQGVGLYGLHKVQEVAPQEKYQLFLENWYKDRIAEGLPLKNVNTTAPMLTLVDYIDENPAYEKLAIEWADWLLTGLPRTEEGGFQHVTSGSGDGKSLILNEQQMWVDTLFMAVLFLNRMGQKYQRQDWIEEGMHQVLMHIKYLFDTHTGLLYHGWDFKTRTTFGGVIWCRGDGWFTLGILDYLEMFGKNISPAFRSIVLDTFRAQVKALSGLQAESGLWHTVLTDPTSYEETSGSAAFAAGIWQGLRTGILDASYKEVAERATEGILAQIGEDGTVGSVSGGIPVGMNADHYKNIMIAPMAYGQSLTIFALAEALKSLA